MFDDELEFEHVLVNELVANEKQIFGSVIGPRQSFKNMIQSRACDRHTRLSAALCLERRV